MSEQNLSRPIRKIAVADHIWEVFEQMSQEMGAERDGLINQAMFMFARLNGFLHSGAPVIVARNAPAAAAPSPEADFDAVLESVKPAPPKEAAAEPVKEPVPVPEPRAPEAKATATPAPRPAAPPPPPEFPLEDKTPLPQAAPVPPPAPPRRAPPPGPRAARAEAAAEAPRRTPEPEVEPRRKMTEAATPAVDAGFEMAPPGSMDNDPDRKLVAERVLETAAELERLIKGKGQPAPEPEPEPAEDVAEDVVDEVGEQVDDVVDDFEADMEPEPEAEGEKALYLVADDGEPRRIERERFLIGRGKHCDLVINSGKVSREHAAIYRDGEDYFIEDLGSSNGTWYNKARIKRRKIDDGDEYFICSDKVKFVVR